MSIQDYRTYRRLEKEFLAEHHPGREYTGDPIEYLEGLREGKRNAVKRTIKTSLTSLAVLATLTFSGMHIYNSNTEYKMVMAEAAERADLNGDGKTSGSEEMAEFFSNLPYPAKYFIRP